ncbi:histone-lysine N-methyltransferase, H3 lysine-79 specific-like [Ranitomeya imitator]|uniref:histone-lysine N-methyltransferase, H3 lysine-79 specific-like n=1 Tax=Ranitomeya imitator TaxID=111125 RepID=UPI0037E8864A
MDSDEMRRFIENFSFDKCKKGNQGFNRVLIQLFGLLGHGKSSFINTCIYVWKDCEFENWSKSMDNDGGHTTERIPYELTENITLVDNRGCGKMDDKESGVIFAQLGNLLPLGKEVQWGEGFGLVERMVKAEKEVKTSDFIFPVFVYSVKKEITNPEKEDLKLLFQTAQKLTGVIPIVVLTHKTAGSLTKTEGIFRDLGIDRIFSFENYTREDHMKTRGKHEEVLKFFCEVVRDVQFRVDQPRDPSEEMKMRRKLVLNYIHECDIKEQQRKVENMKALEQVQEVQKLKQQEEEMKKRREEEERQQEEGYKRHQQQYQWERECDRARQEEEIKALREDPKKKSAEKKTKKTSYFENMFKTKKKDS